MLLWFKRLICKVFKHKHYMVFNSSGLYWCSSSGWYDNRCERCDYKWEETADGRAALIKSNMISPEIRGIKFLK